MIPAVAQTLAEILAEGNSLIASEQIDFSAPNTNRGMAPRLNLYCYDLQENKQMHSSLKEATSQIDDEYSSFWVDISFLIAACDCTPLGEQSLLAEALMLLLPHRNLPEELLVPTLRGHGSLPMTVSAQGLIDKAALWKALGVPLRPALYVTVTTPMWLQTNPIQAQDKKLLLSR